MIENVGRVKGFGVFLAVDACNVNVQTREWLSAAAQQQAGAARRVL
jgi:hypothetical protein